MLSALKAEQLYEELEPRFLPIIQSLDELVKESKEPLEGNCFYNGHSFLPNWFYRYKRINCVNIIRDHGIQTLFEIGFNAGHSATVFLTAMETRAIYTCFDTFEHAYSKPCFDFLKSTLQHDLHAIQGNSIHMFPLYFKTHPEQVNTIDCIHIDGGHDRLTFESDLKYAKLFLKPGGILILDDTQIPHIASEIPFLLKEGYRFILQIPTLEFPHLCLQKP